MNKVGSAMLKKPPGESVELSSLDVPSGSTAAPLKVEAKKTAADDLIRAIKAKWDPKKPEALIEYLSLQRLDVIELVLIQYIILGSKSDSELETILKDERLNPLWQSMLSCFNIADKEAKLSFPPPTWQPVSPFVHVLGAICTSLQALDNISLQLREQVINKAYEYSQLAAKITIEKREVNLLLGEKKHDHSIEAKLLKKLEILCLHDAWGSLIFAIKSFKVGNLCDQAGLKRKGIHCYLLGMTFFQWAKFLFTADPSTIKPISITSLYPDLPITTAIDVTIFPNTPIFGELKPEIGKQTTESEKWQHAQEKLSKNFNIPQAPFALLLQNVQRNVEKFKKGGLQKFREEWQKQFGEIVEQDYSNTNDSANNNTSPTTPGLR